MSQREARARGVSIWHRDVSNQRIQGSVEVWLRGNKKVEIFPQDGTTGKSTDPHYVREISPQNGQTINVSQAYATRAKARRAALRHFPGKA